MADTFAQLGFMKPLDLYKKEKPYWLFIGKPETAPEVDVTNVVTEPVSVPVCDVRNREADYTLETQGFQFIKHDHTFQSFEDEQLLKQVYLPQVEKTIRDVISDAEKVLIYDWRVCWAHLLLTVLPLTSSRSGKNSQRMTQSSYPQFRCKTAPTNLLHQWWFILV